MLAIEDDEPEEQPREQDERDVVGLRFAEAAAGEGELRIVERTSGKTVVAGASQRLAPDDELQLLKPFFENVVIVERWLGTEIAVPDTITDADDHALRQSVGLIEGIVNTWTEVSFTLETDSGEQAIAQGGVLQMRTRWLRVAATARVARSSCSRPTRSRDS